MSALRRHIKHNPSPGPGPDPCPGPGPGHGHGRRPGPGPGLGPGLGPGPGPGPGPGSFPPLFPFNPINSLLLLDRQIIRKQGRNLSTMCLYFTQ